MRIAWTLLCLGVVACGSASGGEPQNGNATVTWGSTTDAMTVGSAIRSASGATAITVQLGNDNVSCSTDLNNSFPPPGLYLVFDIDASTPGTNSQATIAGIHSSGSHIDFDEATGMTTVTSIDTRVMGSLTFMTTDSTGATVTASGTFDVKKCF